jgi:YD repeat-containing protein
LTHSIASSIDLTCHSQKPAISSLVSVKGPSITVRFPPENRTRLPFELAWSPSAASSTPAFTSSSLYFPISARSFCLTQVTDANGGTTGFGYDANSNLTSIIDANSNPTSYTYDSRDRRTAREDALTHSDIYDSYDANGNLTQFTDRRGKVSVYQYDGLNRETFAGFGKSGVARKPGDHPAGNRLALAS